MDSQATYHKDCSACGTDGFIIRHYDTAPDGTLVAPLVMDERTEGWIGIPHGGFGMGAIMELLSLAPSFPDDPARVFPISADFRMGGAQVVVGDTARLTVSAAGGGGTGVIEKEGQPYPYISGEVAYRKDDPEGRKALSSNLPDELRGYQGQAHAPALLRELLRLRGRQAVSGAQAAVQARGRLRRSDRRCDDRF